jgi:hypothetical protein
MGRNAGLAGGAGTNADWEPIKERRQRTPAVVALVSEGASAQKPIRLVLADSDCLRAILLFSSRSLTPERSGEGEIL